MVKGREVQSVKIRTKYFLFFIVAIRAWIE
jgi:hypothetical protein